MLNNSVWPIDRTLSDATILIQSESGSDGNEGVLRIPQSFRHYWSLTIRLFSVIYQDTRWDEVLGVCKDAISVFYKNSRLAYLISKSSL